MSSSTLTIIGFGNIARAIYDNIRPGAFTITLIGRRLLTEVVSTLPPQIPYFGIHENVSFLTSSDCILLSVKPFQVKDVLSLISPYLRPQTLVVSVCAGVDLPKLRSYLSPFSGTIVRCMPNIFISQGKGILPILSGELHRDHWDLLRLLFPGVSIVPVQNDQDLDRATIVVGCSPGFMGLMCKSFIEGIEEMGFSVDKDFILFLFEESLSLYRKEGPSLINRVASKGGATEAGLKRFEELKGNEVIKEMYQKALERIYEMKNKV